MTAFHAIRTLARVAAGGASLRWTQEGFLPGREPGTASGTRRNLIGFKDGTNNLRADELAPYVWARPSDGAPWMAGGTYMVARRIRIALDSWDALTIPEQERAIGRRKLDGAPLSGGTETTPARFNVMHGGTAAIPPDAHIRLASSAANGGQRILRRGYSFSDGVDHATRQPDAGLMFICFQRHPRQFVAIQRRLSATDALNNHIVHTGSAVFACPPGFRKDGHIADTLFAS